MSTIKRDSSTSGSNDLFTWHRCLGHLSFFVLKKIFPQFFLFKSNFFYEPCQLAKYYRSHYPINNNNKHFIPFSLMHSDVRGPYPTNSLSGFRYFMTFVDDCSCATWVYLLKNK